MVSIPVSVYQTVVTSMAQLNDGQANNVQIAMTPLTDDMQTTIKEMDSSESDSEQMVVATHHFQQPGGSLQTAQLVHHTPEQQEQTSQPKSNVPDATQAVEIVTVAPDGTEMKVDLA